MSAKPMMRDRLTDIVNGGVIMFAVGVLLAIVAPHIAHMLGISDSVAGTHDPFWTGLFFGAFGAIHAAVSPVLTAAFRGKSSGNEKGDSPEPALSQAKEQIPQINIFIQQEPTQQASGKWHDQVLSERSQKTEQTVTHI